ncbi:MAG: alpha/beta hydrolase [Planctomycetota bacterium]
MRLIMLIGFVLAGVSALTVWGEPVEPDRIAEYKVTEQGDLRLHVFEPAGHTAGDRRPALVFFFGGGWIGGGPTHFYHQSEYLAGRGVVAICAEYRTRKGHGTTPFECVADALSAMRYVRQHAEEYGIDPDRIGAGGGSAGGHLAMACSTVTADWLDTDPPEQKKISPRPDALVLFNPVYDNSPAPAGYGHDRIGEKYVDFSPAHNLHAGMPPTLVMLGDQDKLIPVATAERVQQKMTELGVRSDLILYPGQGHGFFNRRPTSAKMYHATVRAMDDFLVSLGWLEPLDP